MRGLLLVLLVAACEPPPPPPPAVCKESGSRQWEDVCAPIEFCTRGSVLVPCTDENNVYPGSTSDEECQLRGRVKGYPERYTLHLQKVVYNRKFTECP